MKIYQSINGKFKKLFNKLNLDFNKNVVKFIKKTSEAEENGKNLIRNSSENIQSWKNRLSIEEIRIIKKGTENIWKKFYSLDDW